MHASRKLLVRACVGMAGGLLLGTLVLASGRAPAPPKVLALVGGRVVTQTDAGTIDATIIVRDGKIAAVGPGIAIPADATKIDVAGMVITPGLIDAHGSLWLTPAASQDNSSDAGLEILDEVDPTKEDWKEVARQGVTAVYVQPAQGSLLGGRGAVLRVGPAEIVEDVVIKGSAAAQASLGSPPPAPAAAEAPAAGRGRRGGRGRGQQADPALPPAPAPTSNSLTRFAQYEQLKRTLEAAKKYDDDFKKVEKADAAKAAANKGKQPAEKKTTVSKALVPARGSSTIRPRTFSPSQRRQRQNPASASEANREDDVANAIHLAKELKLRLVLEGVSNPRSATDDIVSGRIPLVLGPFAELEESSANRIDRVADWPKALVAGDGRAGQSAPSATQPRGSPSLARSLQLARPWARWVSIPKKCSGPLPATRPKSSASPIKWAPSKRAKTPTWSPSPAIRSILPFRCA